MPRNAHQGVLVDRVLRDLFVDLDHEHLHAEDAGQQGQRGLADVFGELQVDRAECAEDVFPEQDAQNAANQGGGQKQLLQDGDVLSEDVAQKQQDTGNTKIT